MTIQFRGGPETASALRGLGRAASAEKVIRQALRPAAQLVRDDARALVPVRTGRLRKSIWIGIGRRRRKWAASLRVAHRGKAKAISHLIEFGTRYSRAQPYMRPAWRRNKDEVIRVFGQNIWQRIAREATRRASRGAVRRRRA